LKDQVELSKISEGSGRAFESIRWIRWSFQKSLKGVFELLKSSEGSGGSFKKFHQTLFVD
jgi:hypothetical protein